MTLWTILTDGTAKSIPKDVTVTGDSDGDGQSEVFEERRTRDEPWLSVPSGGVYVKAGQLEADLIGPKDADFDLLLETLDKYYGDWIVVDSAATASSSETLKRRVRAGQCRFTAMSADGKPMTSS